MNNNLISAQQCFAILDQNPVIIDCRFQLSDTEAGRRSYHINHIPGAYYAHLDEDCSGMKTNKTGRHPLPEMASFLKKVTAWGISNDCQVVVYDDNTGAIAAGLWWMLTHIGIDHVAILDGGFSYWQKLGYPVSDVIPAFHQERKPLQSADWQYVTTAQVRHYIEDPQYIIIDARAADRYAGKAEPIDAIAGHIPGALNRFHGLNYDSSGLFKSADELKKEYSALIGNYAPDHVIFYCGSGVTSCANLAAMQLAELPGAKLYLGSWSEWIRDPENPIITLKKN